MTSNIGNNKRVRGDDDGLVSLFQQDALLPEQYLETIRRKHHLEPEKSLMLGVLEDAVACFQKYIDAKRPREKTQFQDTEEWIFEKDSRWLFSFENVCETLGLDPNYLRKGLLRWQQERKRAKAKLYHLNPGQAASERGLKDSQSPRGKPRLLKNATN